MVEEANREHTGVTTSMCGGAGGIPESGGWDLRDSVLCSAHGRKARMVFYIEATAKATVLCTRRCLVSSRHVVGQEKAEARVGSQARKERSAWPSP